MDPLRNSSLLLNLVVLFGFISSTNAYLSAIFLILFVILIFPLYLHLFYFSILVFLVTYIFLGQALSGGTLIPEELIRMMVFSLVIGGLVSGNNFLNGKIENNILHFIFTIFLIFSLGNIFSITIC